MKTAHVILSTLYYRHHGTTLTVLFMEVSLFRRFYTYIHMSMQGMSNRTEQWCPVKGGGCVSEVSFNRGLPYSFTSNLLTYV